VTGPSQWFWLSFGTLLLCAAGLWLAAWRAEQRK
jgi:hypothetical protein